MHPNSSTIALCIINRIVAGHQARQRNFLAKVVFFEVGSMAEQVGNLGTSCDDDNSARIGGRSLIPHRGGSFDAIPLQFTEAGNADTG